MRECILCFQNGNDDGERLCVFSYILLLSFNILELFFVCKRLFACPCTFIYLFPVCLYRNYCCHLTRGRLFIFVTILSLSPKEI